MRKTTTESDGGSTFGKSRRLRDFLKLSGAGLAAAFTGVACGQGVGLKPFKDDTPAPERLPAIRDRGYEQPVIATEFGVVLGSGDLDVTPREAAARLFQSVTTFLAAGGKRFCCFPQGAVGDPNAFVDRNFPNVFMVGGEADEPQFLFFAYHALTRWLEGATPIDGPTEKGSLRVCSFERGEERIDCVWSAGGEGPFVWETSEPIRYVNPIGRQRRKKARRRKKTVTLKVGSEPYLVISPV